MGYLVLILSIITMMFGLIGMLLSIFHKGGPLDIEFEKRLNKVFTVFKISGVLLIIIIFISVIFNI
jgi:hypothetical protein